MTDHYESEDEIMFRRCDQMMRMVARCVWLGAMSAFVMLVGTFIE